MPSGFHGCARCGSPTTTMVRARVEDFADGKRKVIMTRTRSFCEECGDDAWDDVIDALERGDARRADPVDGRKRLTVGGAGGNRRP